jgi:hypothetical protein
LITYITDNVSIIEYRLDILEDVLANPDLRAAMESALPLIDELEETNLTDARGSNNDPPFIQTVRRLGELEVYVDCIHKLQLGFTDCDVKSAGLSRLKAIIGKVYEDPDFKALVMLTNGKLLLRHVKISWIITRQMAIYMFLIMIFLRCLPL